MKRALIALTLGLTLALLPGNRAVRAAEPAPTTISLDAANRILAAAIEKSSDLNVPMNIAVLDAGGNLKLFARMDGALLGSIDIAIKKAKTSILFNAPSGALGELSQPGGDLYGIERSNGGLITFPGGLPIRNADGAVVGSIGVSGSSVANDLAVAEAGAAVF